MCNAVSYLVAEMSVSVYKVLIQKEVLYITYLGAFHYLEEVLYFF